MHYFYYFLFSFVLIQKTNIYICFENSSLCRKYMFRSLKHCGYHKNHISKILIIYNSCRALKFKFTSNREPLKFVKYQSPKDCNAYDAKLFAETFYLTTPWLALPLAKLSEPTSTWISRRTVPPRNSETKLKTYLIFNRFSSFQRQPLTDNVVHRLARHAATLGPVSRKRTKTINRRKTANDNSLCCSLRRCIYRLVIIRRCEEFAPPIELRLWILIRTGNHVV